MLAKAKAARAALISKHKVDGHAISVGEGFVDAYGFECKEYAVTLVKGPDGFGLDVTGFNRLAEVAAGSPADKAGLHKFDQIVSVDGQDLDPSTPVGPSCVGKDKLIVVVQRPPAEAHKKIFEEEENGAEKLVERSVP